MRLTMFLATLFALLGTITLGNAQTAGQPRAGQLDTDGHVRAWFDASDLKVGDSFPAVEVYDEAGRPFSTRSLKGQYTVVVNGCLT